MAKRFIDTGLFDDPWFMELSQDAKIIWLYLITKCDHAGIIDLNRKLTSFQTGVKQLSKALEELGNRLVTLDCGKNFIPKFIKYQYPNGLSEKVAAQKSVIAILNSYSLLENDKLTVKQLLPNTYPSVQDKDKDIDKETVKDIDRGIVKGESESLEQRAEKFKAEILAYKSEYDVTMLEKFYLYWAEPNKSGSKMRYEMEKTWKLSLRLKKWSLNDYGKKSKQSNSGLKTWINKGDNND